MSTTNPYVWEEFHRELANKLLQYKNNRKELISKVKSVYEVAKMSMPRLEKDELVDIDPFTIFALFNRTPLLVGNRIKIMSAIAKEFALAAPVPTSFEGVPLVYHMTATFYGFIGDREDGDIDNLWALFESALNYSNDQNPDNKDKVAKLFESVVNKKFNGTSKVTMALYWTAPDVYLSLDNKSKWYIYDSGKMPAELTNSLPTIECAGDRIVEKIKSEKYFSIIEKIQAYLHTGGSPLSNFKDLCKVAWEQAALTNKEDKEKNLPQENAIGDDDSNKVHYWVYSPGDNASCWDEFYNAKIMGIGWDEIGNLEDYSTRAEIQQKIKDVYKTRGEPITQSLATWQFAHEMKPGDIVFAKKGRSEIIGQGIVESDYKFDPNRKDYRNIRQVNWVQKGSWPHPGGMSVMKTLTDITQYTDYVARLNAIFEEGEEETTTIATSNKDMVPYTKEDFLKQVYMTEENYETLVGLIKNKKNVILQGAPGVGKTYAAKRLAYSILGKKNPDCAVMVQFHQSYSYEDFIMGFRPSEKGEGYELKTGAFYNFCKKAAVDGDNDYFFIIDEINRGNLSKIFGELFMLIESDKRGISMPLLYSSEEFSVPNNVHIIGMMNTADRSLALLDYALRRRFAFFEMEPGFDTDGFHEYQERLNNPKFDQLINCVKNLNEEIAKDDSLGAGFRIGHSYFCGLDKEGIDVDKALPRIVDYEIIPLLKEYWFDNPANVTNWQNNLRNAIK